MPVRPGQRSDLVMGDIAEPEQLFSAAVDMEGQVPRRVTERFDGTNAGGHVVARLEERRLLGQRHHEVAEEGGVFLQVARMLAGRRPEIVLRAADRIARVGKERPPVLDDPADVIGVSVRKNDEIDVLGLNSRGQRVVPRASLRRVSEQIRARRFRYRTGSTPSPC